MQMLFEVIPESTQPCPKCGQSAPQRAQVIPRLPFDFAGDPRRADGERFFSLEQAAVQSGESEAYLRTLWLSTMHGVFNPEDLEQ